VADDALALESPRWRELAQAYGPADDVPRLLEHLDRVGERERAELWFGLWGLLCHQGTVYTASYAAAPHLVAFAARRPLADRVQALHLAGAIEAGRHGPDAPPVPDDLARGYHAAVAGIAALVARSAAEPWDADGTQVLASVLAIAKGHPRFGLAALNLEPVVSCPVCGAAHAPAGWGPGAR
jgi:hypothetical protein